MSGEGDICIAGIFLFIILLIVLKVVVNKMKRDIKEKRKLNFIRKKMYLQEEVRNELRQERIQRANLENRQSGIPKKATPQAKLLYYALRDKGVNCHIESYDGYKHVDISVPDARLNIEVDGIQHSTYSKQLSADLKRDEHSALDGYVTKRYTNQQIEQHLEEIVDALVKVIEQRKEQV